MEGIGILIVIVAVLLTLWGVSKVERGANTPLDQRPGSPEYYNRLYPEGDRGWREMCAAQGDDDGSFARSLRVIASCRQADPEEYRRWLAGYLDNGGEITHKYDYDLPDDCYYAYRDLVVPKLYGSTSVSIIIPFGVNVEYGDLGHNNLYFMDGFRQVGDFVPVYTNTNIK